MSKCTAITKKGKACSLPSIPGEKWCSIHRPSDQPLPDEKRCTFVSQIGERCKNKKCKRNDLCSLHNKKDPLPDNVRCTQIFKNGRRCHRHIISDERKLCVAHDPIEKEKKNPPDEKRCTFVSQSGERCRCKRISIPDKNINFDMCKKHFVPKKKISSLSDDKKVDTLTVDDMTLFKTKHRTMNSLIVECNRVGTYEDANNIKLMPHIYKLFPNLENSILKVLVRLQLYDSVRCNVCYYLGNKISLIANLKKKLFVYENSDVNRKYFLLLRKNHVLQSSQLYVYRYTKNTGQKFKDYIMCAELKTPFDWRYDRFIFLKQNSKEIDLSIEKKGVLSCNVNINLTTKEINIKPILYKSIFFTEENLKLCKQYGEYTFYCAKNGELIQSLTSTGLVFCKYIIPGITPMTPKSKVLTMKCYVNPNERNKDFSLLKIHFMKCKGCVYPIKILRKGDPLRILNQARYLDIFLKKINRWRVYSTFVISRIIIVSKMNLYESK